MRLSTAADFGRVLGSVLKVSFYTGKALFRPKHKRCKTQLKPKAPLHRKGELPSMKKSFVFTVLAVFAALVGVLTAAYLHLRRREKELDEYENLLFSEEFNTQTPPPEESGEPV